MEHRMACAFMFCCWQTCCKNLDDACLFVWFHRVFSVVNVFIFSVVLWFRHQMPRKTMSNLSVEYVLHHNNSIIMPTSSFPCLCLCSSEPYQISTTFDCCYLLLVTWQTKYELYLHQPFMVVEIRHRLRNMNFFGVSWWMKPLLPLCTRYTVRTLVLWLKLSRRGPSKNAPIIYTTTFVFVRRRFLVWRRRGGGGNVHKRVIAICDHPFLLYNTHLWAQIHAINGYTWWIVGGWCPSS